VIDYYLKAKPKGAVSLDVVDAQGGLVASFKSKPKPASPESGKSHEKTEDQPAATSKPEEEETPDDDPDGGDRYKVPVLPAEIGVNRVAWDLRYKGAEKIKGAKVDTGNPAMGPLVNPGTYTLKLTVDGKTVT